MDMTDTPRTKNLIEQLNVGLIKNLEKKTGICKINLDQRGAADRHTVLMWEQKNTCFLPEDMKNFYLTSDGFLLTWSVKMDNGALPVGKMYINSISQLIRIGGGSSKNVNSVNPSLLDLEGDSDTEDEVSGLEKPTFDNRCKIYELDPCDGYGKVCLVYRDNKPGRSEAKIEIWFLDRALRWHYLTDSFTAYYRLMIMHMGLPQWQYAFTDIGLSHQAKQWFSLFASTRLELDHDILSNHSVDTDRSATSSLQLDVSKVFKGKVDKKKPVPSQTQQPNQQNVKKKPLVNSAKSQPMSSGTTRGSASLSQMANKPAVK